MSPKGGRIELVEIHRSFFENFDPQTPSKQISIHFNGKFSEFTQLLGFFPLLSEKPRFSQNLLIFIPKISTIYRNPTPHNDVDPLYIYVIDA